MEDKEILKDNIILRECEGRYIKGIKYKYFTNGKFHMWGNRLSESLTTSCTYTVAIVELEDGSVINVMPEDLVFSDTKK